VVEAAGIAVAEVVVVGIAVVVEAVDIVVVAEAVDIVVVVEAVDIVVVAADKQERRTFVGEGDGGKNGVWVR
jgi:hypothetical protein